MKPKTAVIDYGMGNLRSVSKALQLCGAEVDIISSADEVKKYNSIVLPGVGSFGPAINIIKSKGLDVAIKEHIADKKMFLEASVIRNVAYLTTGPENGKVTFLTAYDKTSHEMLDQYLIPAVVQWIKTPQRPDIVPDHAFVATDKEAAPESNPEN